jgi:hypothetical protein
MSRVLRPGVVAASLLLLTLAATVLGVVADAGDGWSIIGETWPMVIGVSFVTCGALITTRQPGNSIGWLLCAIGALLPLGLVLTVYADVGADRGWVGAEFAAWATGLLWAPLITLIAIPLLLVFPDGRLPSSRWRWVLWCAGAFVVLAVVGNGFSDWGADGGRENPYALTGHQDLLLALRDLAVVPGVAGMLGAIASLVVRYRRADATVRTQMRLFVVVGALLLPGIAVVDLFQDSRLSLIAFPVLLSLPPVAIGVAVLRYRLYDIDRVLSRTVSYAVLTVLLAGVYLAGVVGLGSVVRLVTGGGGGDLVVAASTLGVAAVFGPLRRRVQAVVDHRFNRARYDAQRTVEQFGRDLRDEVDLIAVRDALTTTAAAVMQPRSMGVWLRSPEASRELRPGVGTPTGT